MPNRERRTQAQLSPAAGLNDAYAGLYRICVTSDPYLEEAMKIWVCQEGHHVNEGYYRHCEGCGKPRGNSWRVSQLFNRGARRYSHESLGNPPIA